jgi:hypothetical protein
MTLSSSDTKEALKLLFPSPPRDPISHVSEPFSSSGSNQFVEWPKTNNMETSAYIALTSHTSSSRASIVNVSHGGQEPCADDLSTHRSCSRVTSSQKLWRQKHALAGGPRRISKKMKFDTECALAAPPPHSGSVSASNFDKSE